MTPLPCPAAASARTVWLDSLGVDATMQGRGSARAGKSFQGKPITIAGRTFEHGMGTHADSALHMDLKGAALAFHALVGVDDEVKGQKGSVEFVVRGDRKVLWKSGLMRAGDPAREAKVVLRGVRRLELRVEDGGDGIDDDHADWADARFELQGPDPVVLRAARRKPYILTPKPPRAPRINGARIFGVRPGSPFLFAIPATGDRPMSFSADNLPAGLQLDAGTGQITGAIKEPGEHRVTLRAANGQGRAERPFRIVCGERLALTPHMGWNSWYIWENHVTDQIMRDAADAMVSTGMIQHGYTYVNIDDCWSVKPGAKDPSLGGEPRDAGGRVNSNLRFPDMKALTDYIHSKGLKAGIYTSPGPLTCASHVAAWEHEEQDVQRYVEWGFDFLKYDWCSYGRIAKGNSREELQKPYRKIGEILRRQPRDIVLNLCQYGMGNVWEWGKVVGGNSWRTAGDLGLTFEGIANGLFRDGFDVYARNRLHEYGGPGAWNDPDYLLLGYLSNWKGQTAPTPLTVDEQYTHVTLWCLVAAPLIYSGDMTRLDEFTLSLLTNDELLEVDQDSLGKPARPVYRKDDLEVWARELEDGSIAAGLFNRDLVETRLVTARWTDLGIRGRKRVRDLWRQKDLGSFNGSFSARVPPHGAVAVRLFDR